MVHTAVLAVHVVAGSLGLVLGPFAVARPSSTGWAAALGAVYQPAVAVLCATAVALAVWSPALWWLATVALATEVAALAGWWVRRRRRAGWRALQLRLTGGSYIALLTALVVVSVPSPYVWALPTVVGTPLIERAAARSRGGDRAKAPSSLTSA
jgi:hypothetical protein